MARRSRTSNKGRRDNNLTIANNPLLPFLLDDIPIIQDRRSFHPSPQYAPALTTSTQPAKVRVRARPRTYQHSLKKNLSNARMNYLGLEFSAPEKTLVCIRRNARKEVLHALRKAGKRGQKKPRRNRFSDVHC